MRKLLILAFFLPLIASGQTFAQAGRASIDLSTCSKPDGFYPRQSKLMNESGRVLLRFTVESSGKLTSVIVERSSGLLRLDEAAVAFLNTCKGRQGGIGEGVSANTDTFEVVWSLPSENATSAPSSNDVVDNTKPLSKLPACNTLISTGLWDKCYGEKFLLAGGSYLGEFQLGNLGGRGVWTRSNGVHYVGSFVDGFPEGEGIAYSYDGQVLFSGKWKKGTAVCQAPLDQALFPPTPPRKSALSNLMRCVGQRFTAPCFGMKTYRSTDFYIGEWQSGQRHGFGLLSYAGERYIGEFQNNCMSGNGVQYFSEGSGESYKYVGQYLKCARNGLGTLIYADGSRLVGNFKDGTVEGEAIKYDPKGTILSSGKWRGGLLVSEIKLVEQFDVDIGKFPFSLSESSESKRIEAWGVDADEEVRALKTEAKRLEEKKRARQLASGSTMLRLDVESASVLPVAAAGNQAAENRPQKTSPLPQCAAKLASRCESGAFMDGCWDKQLTLNGVKYVGEFRSGRRHGDGVEYSANGSVLRSGRWAEGSFVEAYPIGAERFPY